MASVRDYTDFRPFSYQERVAIFPIDEAWLLGLLEFGFKAAFEVPALFGPWDEYLFVRPQPKTMNRQKHQDTLYGAPAVHLRWLATPYKSYRYDASHVPVRLQY
jgi:hypothetical protein